MKNAAGRILVWSDLSGTTVFALEGAWLAIGANLDALGVLVLAFVTALAGGILRDVLIGATPPASIADWRYAAAALGSGATALLLRPALTAGVREVVVYLDAAGLGLFAVAGAQKATAAGLHPLVAILMGAITAAGGGAIADLLLARVPLVLHADVYATAALAGAAVMLLGRRCGLAETPAAILGALVCFGLRVTAVTQHWNLPAAGRVGL